MAIIALDIDDVLCDFVSEWLRLYRLDTDDMIYKSDITDWNISQFVKYPDKIYGYISDPNTYNLAKPIFMGKWGVHNLRKMGHRIVFCTSSPIGLQGRKFKWLDDNGFYPKHNDYFEMGDKSLLNIDVLVDDNYENITGTSGWGILFSQDWNLKYEYQYRSSNWVDIIKMIGEKFV